MCIPLTSHPCQSCNCHLSEIESFWNVNKFCLEFCISLNANEVKHIFTMSSDHLDIFTMSIGYLDIISLKCGLSTFLCFLCVIF